MGNSKDVRQGEIRGEVKGGSHDPTQPRRKSRTLIRVCTVGDFFESCLVKQGGRPSRGYFWDGWMLFPQDKRGTRVLIGKEFQLTKWIGFNIFERSAC